MSLPWFPFYVDDFMASPRVRRMDAESVGVYLLLLIEQWQAKGPLALSEDGIADLANAMRTQCERIKSVLTACFESTPDGYINRKLERVYNEQAAKSQSARMAARVRWGNGNKDNGSNANALRTQSEGNAIQNQNKIQSTPSLRSGVTRARAHERPTIETTLDALTLASVRGLYGGEGREGTDERVWGSLNDQATRERVLVTAALRWKAEGRPFNSRLFRRILQTVIEEQSENGSGKGFFEGVPLLGDGHGD